MQTLRELLIFLIPGHFGHLHGLATTGIAVAISCPVQQIRKMRTPERLGDHLRSQAMLVTEAIATHRSFPLIGVSAFAPTVFFLNESANVGSIRVPYDKAETRGSASAEQGSTRPLQIQDVCQWGDPLGVAGFSSLRMPV